jgi:PGM1 C-terminal domain
VRFWPIGPEGQGEATETLIRWRLGMDAATRAHSSGRRTSRRRRCGRGRRCIVARHGVHFDQARQAGVVFHMISCLSEHGRVGLTAVGDTPAQAEATYRRAERMNRPGFSGG